MRCELTGRALLVALQEFPDEILDRTVLVETGPDTRDLPATGVAMTGPGAGVLILTTASVTR